MSYIWINPVIDNMYDAAALDDFLRRYGHERFHTTTDWLSVVKEKYRIAAERSDGVIVDMRCPKTREVLEELKVADKVTMPEISPILIHCGQEGAKREELKGEEKIITTPCQALADMGNALDMENTWFVPWNKFIESIGAGPKGVNLEQSPIPPGFFSELGLNTVSLTGEEEIRNYFQEGISKDVKLMEILFCKNGCHNGDGIKGCE